MPPEKAAFLLYRKESHLSPGRGPEKARAAREKARAAREKPGSPGYCPADIWRQVCSFSAPSCIQAGARRAGPVPPGHTAAAGKARAARGRPSCARGAGVRRARRLRPPGLPPAGAARVRATLGPVAAAPPAPEGLPARAARATVGRPWPPSTQRPLGALPGAVAGSPPGLPACPGCTRCPGPRRLPGVYPPPGAALPARDVPAAPGSRPARPGVYRRPPAAPPGVCPQGGLRSLGANPKRPRPPLVRIFAKFKGCFGTCLMR